MINNPDWQNTKVKPYLHQLSLECIEEIAVFMEGIDTEEMDCDTYLVMQEILLFFCRWLKAGLERCMLDVLLVVVL